jgi:hypothetical protein
MSESSFITKTIETVSDVLKSLDNKKAVLAVNVLWLIFCYLFGKAILAFCSESLREYHDINIGVMSIFILLFLKECGISIKLKKLCKYIINN